MSFILFSGSHRSNLESNPLVRQNNSAVYEAGCGNRSHIEQLAGDLHTQTPKTTEAGIAGFGFSSPVRRRTSLQLLVYAAAVPILFVTCLSNYYEILHVRRLRTQANLEKIRIT